MNKSIPALVTILGFAGLAVAPSAFAQQQKPQWGKVCSKAGESDICNVQYNVLTAQGQLITGVNLLTAKGKIKRRIFQVAVPTGRYIPQGVKMVIDKGKTNTLPYSICLPDRCIAEVPLSDGLVKALKGGGVIQLTSTNFRSQQNPVKVTLAGFTAAFDGPPLKKSDVDARKRKIGEELQKKAEETARKLKEAQEKAKGN